MTNPRHSDPADYVADMREDRWVPKAYSVFLPALTSARDRAGARPWRSTRAIEIIAILALALGVGLLSFTQLRVSFAVSVSGRATALVMAPLSRSESSGTRTLHQGDAVLAGDSLVVRAPSLGANATASGLATTTGLVLLLPSGADVGTGKAVVGIAPIANIQFELHDMTGRRFVQGDSVCFPVAWEGREAVSSELCAGLRIAEGNGSALTLASGKNDVVETRGDRSPHLRFGPTLIPTRQARFVGKERLLLIVLDRFFDHRGQVATQ